MLIPGPAVPGGEKVLVDTMKFLIRIYLLQFRLGKESRVLPEFYVP
jgi:hypothetical protein